MAFTIENSLGVMFVGVLLSTLLWGVACSQVWTYYRTSSDDPKALKLLVAATWLSDAVFTVLVIYSLYTYTVTHFADVMFLISVARTIPVSIPFLQLTGTLVQGFYAFRIWRLSRRNVLVTGIAVLTIAAELAMCILYTVKAIPITNFLQVNADMGPYLTSYSAVSVVADWYIAGAMCFFLARSKSHSKADNIVNQLIVFTVTTGLLPSVCALVIFFADVLGHQGLIYLAPFFCIGKLYVISFLAALNMRSSMRAALYASSPLELEPRSGNMNILGSHANRSGSKGSKVDPTGSGQALQLSIKIDTVFESMVDPSPLDSAGDRETPLATMRPPRMTAWGIAGWRRSQNRDGQAQAQAQAQAPDLEMNGVVGSAMASAHHVSLAPVKSRSNTVTSHASRSKTNVGVNGASPSGPDYPLLQHTSPISPVTEKDAMDVRGSRRDVDDVEMGVGVAI